MNRGHDRLMKIRVNITRVFLTRSITNIYYRYKRVILFVPEGYIILYYTVFRPRSAPGKTINEIIIAFSMARTNRARFLYRMNYNKILYTFYTSVDVASSNDPKISHGLLYYYNDTRVIIPQNEILYFFWFLRVMTRIYGCESPNLNTLSIIYIWHLSKILCALYFDFENLQTS